MLSYNDFIGTETLCREYKEFSLHKTGLQFDISEAEYYCSTNKFEFDHLVLTNLEKYIEQYIPKYMCGFLNSGIEGEIWIGADDFGFVKGIPLSISKSLDKTYLKQIIDKTILKSIRIDNVEDICNYYSFEIIPINKPPTIQGLHPQYESYINKRTEFIKQYQSFLQDYQNWQKKYEMVNMKLVDIVNVIENRSILIAFMESSEHRNEIALEIIRDPSFKLQYLSGEDIKDIKKDPTNIFYWVTTLKDKICEEYKRDKPYFLNKFKYRYIPFTLIISVSDMIPYWSDQIELYLIQIKIKGPNTSSYSYFNGTQWIRCNRLMNFNQPTVLPFD